MLWNHENPMKLKEFNGILRDSNTSANGFVSALKNFKEILAVVDKKIQEESSKIPLAAENRKVQVFEQLR